MKRTLACSLFIGALTLACVIAPVLGQQQIMGEVQFSGATKVEQSSGVWVDGQYVGFLKELKGGKRVMLLPGKHEISVRQAGYGDFIREIAVEPGQKQMIPVQMLKDPAATWPKVTSELKLKVEPDRAAVFVDDKFAGHVGDMLISPGAHTIKIALPGYQTFETEVNLLPAQTAEIKTELVKGSIEQANPLIYKQSSEARAAVEQR